jgi:hypothetical protein
MPLKVTNQQSNITTKHQNNNSNHFGRFSIICDGLSHLCQMLKSLFLQCLPSSCYRTHPQPRNYTYSISTATIPLENRASVKLNIENYKVLAPKYEGFTTAVDRFVVKPTHDNLGHVKVMSQKAFDEIDGAFSNQKYTGNPRSIAFFEKRLSAASADEAIIRDCVKACEQSLSPH